MAKWRIKLVGLAHVYRFVEIEGADLDAACEQTEKTYNQDETADLDGWIVDEVVTHGPDAVHVASASQRRL